MTEKGSQTLQNGLFEGNCCVKFVLTLYYLKAYLRPAFFFLGRFAETICI